MGDQNYSIEFFISFPTIYHYVVCDDGKVPAKIVLLYGGKSSYSQLNSVLLFYLTQTCKILLCTKFHAEVLL